jgi:hypothetical protein
MSARIAAFGPTWRIYGLMFSNRSATVDQGCPLFRQFIHITKNKIVLPADMLRKDENTCSDI